MNRLLPYFQLIRLPNIFTAWGDVVFAALATGALIGQFPAFLLVLLASTCFYCSGMVWNDYFDVDIDERYRPFRPLPSGKVKMSTALVLASVLMVAGTGFAIASDVIDGGFRGFSTMLSIGLIFCILLYDGTLKHTWMGPIAMGACRFLNVLLGFSLVPWANWMFIPALAVGVYIAGVTWFARTEAEESNQTMLLGAAGVMALAVVFALTIPAVIADDPIVLDDETNLPVSRAVWFGQLVYPYLLIGFLLLIGLPIWKAIEHPSPNHVQGAVKRLIFGLVLLDAILTTAFIGPWGLLLLLLLAPANFLGKWVYST